jgi:hypothetical protein
MVIDILRLARLDVICFQGKAHLLTPIKMPVCYARISQLAVQPTDLKSRVEAQTE